MAFDRKLIRLRPAALSAGAIGAGGTGAAAVGAFALGALAMGAVAIGALAIGRLSIGRMRLRHARIDHLSVGQLEIDGQPVKLVQRRSSKKMKVKAKPLALPLTAEPGIVASGKKKRTKSQKEMST